MRKLLKKYGFVPDKLVTDNLRSYRAAAGQLGLANRHDRGRWCNSRRRIRISRPDDESAGAPDRRKEFSPCMPQPKTPSTSSAISPQQERTELSERQPYRRGETPSLRLERDVRDDLLRVPFADVTKPLFAFDAPSRCRPPRVSERVPQYEKEL